MTARNNGVMCGPCAQMMREAGPIEEPYGTPGRPYHGRAWKRRARAALDLVNDPRQQTEELYPPGIEAQWTAYVQPEIRRFAMDNLRRDYGYDDAGWEKARAVLAGAPLTELLSQLRPSVDTLRSVWTICGKCGEYHDHTAPEPLDRPEYQEALNLARARWG